MWIAPQDRKTPTGDTFIYLATPRDQTRLDEVLSLTGPLNGLSVLDLGSGTLLSDELKNCKRAIVVDFSKTVCDALEKFAPWCQVICRDVLEFLTDNKEQFDITICQGLLEYLPPNGLATIARLAPSSICMIGAPIAEGYLLYETRTVIYSPKDILSTMKRYGWIRTKDLPRKEHLWARFERI